MQTFNTIHKVTAVLAMAAIISSCKKEHNEPSVTDEGKEFKYVRVLVGDELSNKLHFIDPFAGQVTAFDAKYPLASLYATASGRYAAVLYQNQNLTEIFDSGLQLHTDHVDEVNAPKWAAITANGLRPTHFKSKGAESLIFNDGDGTLSAADESSFNTAGSKFQSINAGLLPHHGAMAQFDNGNYAVTVAATTGASPDRVLVINKSGALVHASTLAIGAIHGNATNGSIAVFGGFTTTAAAAGGVLVVQASGEQRLIPNPDGFGAFRLASIYYAEAAKKFIGYVATRGAYLIDVRSGRISPIYEGTDAFQCKVDYTGKRLLVLTLDGKLRVYDLATGSMHKEGSIIPAVTSTDTYKPVLEASSRFAYITLPTSGEVLQVDLSDLSNSVKHKVTSRPVRMTIFGFESDASHG